METRELTCIRCPIGCQIKVELENYKNNLSEQNFEDTNEISETQTDANEELLIDMNELEGLEGHPTAAGGLLSTAFINKLVTKKYNHIALTTRKTSKYSRGLTPYEMRHRK